MAQGINAGADSSTAVTSTAAAGAQVHSYIANRTKGDYLNRLNSSRASPAVCSG